MDTPKDWYNVVKFIKAELDRRKKAGKFHPSNILIGEQTEKILQLFNDCEFVGFPKENPHTSAIISNSMQKIQEPESEVLNFIPNHPFFNLYLGLLFLERVLELIKHEYESNLNVTIEHLENLIYQSDDYQNLIEVSRNIGRKAINKQQHLDFAVLKEHINEQLKYIERKNSLNKLSQNTNLNSRESLSYPSEKIVPSKKYKAIHYVLTYILEANAMGTSLPIGRKKELEKIGNERIGNGSGNTFYKKFNEIINKELFLEKNLIEIGGEKWREIVLSLSTQPEQVDGFLKEKQL